MDTMNEQDARATAKAKAIVAVIEAVSDCIRELGSVPSGHLYAQLMSKLNIDQYTAIISFLKDAGLVKESGYLLTWIGPVSRN